MDRLRVAIAGAGVAGAATAWCLARRGVRGVALFEREKDPGAHSTARNAAILRTAVEDPVLTGLARESRAFFQDPPHDFSEHPLLDPVGLVLAAPEEAAAALRSWIGVSASGGTEIDPQEARRRVPLLGRSPAAAWLVAGDGVLDVAAILAGFLRGAAAGGVQLRTGCPIRRILHEGGKVTGVETPAGTVEVGAVVVAAGGWAGSLAATAGCPLPLVPYRRHLVVTERLETVDPRWPVVWITGEEFYFRPESGGLLMSPCDTDAVDPEEGEVSDPAVLETLATRVERWIPALMGAGTARVWAGMRTYSADGRFVVGPDPRLRGLFWAAGLGGHGITSCPAVGRLAADWITDGRCTHPAAPRLLPDRLAGTRDAVRSRP